jgi:predicted dehydrogenase|tara:strand:- start:382 stop:549 length:168 start_codon:yes stop_codon:yes gene_type:complete
MNFAAIGLGSFGQKRAKAIKDSEQGELVAIFDTNKDIANKASKDLEVPVKDYKDL